MRISPGQNALAALLLVVVMALSCGTKVISDPPVARIEPKVDTLFGTEMVDNYFWLRDDSRSKPEVIEYLEEENSYADYFMRDATILQEELFNEMKGRIKETDLSVPVRRGDYYYYSRTEEGKQYSIYCRKKGSLEGAEEIMLDVNQLAEGKEFMRVGAYAISPDQNLLAYATDETGNERYTLQFKNLSSGEVYSDRIEGASTDLAWANDNKTIFYTTPDDAWRTDKLWRHILGNNTGQDEMIFHEMDEMFWLGVNKSKDEEYIFLGLGSQTSSEFHFLKADDPEGKFQIISPRAKDIEYEVGHHRGQLYIVTNDNALNFKLVTTSVDKPSRDNWRDLLGHRENVKIDGIDLFADYMVLYERENGLRQITVREFASGKSHRIEFPEPVYSVYGSENPEFDMKLLRFSYQSLTTPRSVYDYDMSSRQRELKKQKEVLGGYDPAEYQSERVVAIADDGTEVPMSIVYRKGMVKDGSHPLYLYGYGSYGSSMDPYFSSNRLSLLERGFVFAMAHIRGGGEMGRAWYYDGKLLNKKNTFTDFITCGRHLIEEGYTSSDKLIISGGSAGGLLIGAVVNMAPDLAEIAVASVPFVDVINTMMDASIPLTVIEYEEWGNPNMEEYFNYMLSYSPYDNVETKDYPHMFIEGGFNDTRVQYWEPAKWAAKLRALKTDDNTLLLRTNMGAGHGGASGRYDYLKEIAVEYAFILKTFGMNK